MFDDKGDVHPVTVLQAGPCVITQIKRNNKEGYEAAQIGLVEFVKGKNVSKAQQGHFAKHDLPPVKFIREVAMVDGTEAATAEAAAEGDAGASNGDGLKVGAKVLVDIFNNEKFVDVIGVSKGRGFAGVVRRHHFGGGPAAHGHMFQVQGSIGASSFPSRVFPGQRMSGHMGVDQVTVRNLASGVCYSQVHQLRSPGLPRPMGLGHEGSGMGAAGIGDPLRQRSGRAAAAPPLSGRLSLSYRVRFRLSATPSP